MPKIFQFNNEKVARKNQAEAMDAQAWFQAQQPLLLWMANKSKDGRKLLRLDQTKLERVDQIAMNYVGQNRYVRDGGTLFRPQYRRVTTTDFRVGAKWANLINYQWDWFCELAREYYAMMEQRKLNHIGHWMPVTNWWSRLEGMRLPAGTTSTFQPVAGVNSPVDGYVLHLSAVSWSAARDAADGLVAGVSDANTEIIYTDTQYLITRSFQLFDSSVIGSDSISSGVKSVAADGQAVTNADSSSIDVISTTPAATNNLTTADYDQIGSTVFATKTIASWTTTDNVYNDFTLDANGIANINKTGISKFGLRNSRDTGNSAPTGINRVFGRYADTTGTTSDPKLVVVHVAVASFIPETIIIM